MADRHIDISAVNGYGAAIRREIHARDEGPRQIKGSGDNVGKLLGPVLD